MASPVVPRGFPWLLALYPPAVRSRFGPEMQATFAEAHAAARRRGTWTVIRLWVVTIAGTLQCATLDWIEAARTNRRRSAQPPPSRHPERLMALFDDLRVSVRTLARRPTFLLAAVATLALGIGANTAVFSVVHGILWRSLNYERPDELVMLWPEHAMSVREAVFLREHSTTLSSIATVAGWTIALTGVENPTQVYGARTSPNVFSLLGVPPLIGRTLQPDDAVPGAAPVVMLSHRLWRTRFGADSSLIGRSIVLDGDAHEVVGVMPASFEILNPTMQLWIPLPEDPQEWFYTSGVSEAVARLAPGVTAAAAGSELHRLLREYGTLYSLPDTFGDSATVVSLLEHLVGGYRTMLLVIIGAVGFILLMAGSNLSNLLLAKASGQRREMATRAALGATRGRMVRSLLVETMVLSAIGGLVGLALAYGGVALLKTLVPAETPRIALVSVDTTVLTVCFGFAILTGAVFSLAPGLTMTRLDLQRDVAGLRSDATASSSGHRLRSALVVLQVALAVTLVVGAGLMIRTTQRLSAVDPGFEPNQVLTLRLQPTGASYDTPEKYRQYYTDLFGRLGDLPNVVSVGAVQHLPLSGWSWGAEFEVVGQPVPDGQAKPRMAFRIVSGDYFESMGIRVLEGRRFNASDGAGSERVGIVNETFARRFWNGESPVGQHIRGGGQNRDEIVTIVGVVNDVRHDALDQPSGPTLYRPHAQTTMPGLMLAVRTVGNPSRVARSVQDVIQELDPNVPVSHVEPLSGLVARSFSRLRLVMVLLGVFAGVAIALGAIGVYGVTSFSVSRRTGEFGIRMALGATEARVRRDVLRTGMVRAGLGISIGLAAALGLNGVLSGLVFGVSTTDPATYGGVAVVMGLVALGASYIPAWRATRIDPATALRTE